MPPADRKNRASATDAVATDEEFPFDRETASVEEKQLANAVARGKMVLWPVTFVATLGIGVGCSGGGIVKTRGWSESPAGSSALLEAAAYPLSLSLPRARRRPLLLLDLRCNSCRLGGPPRDPGEALFHKRRTSQA